ncbi:2'-5' RNA ligase family protein [Streptomyces sp. NPDC039016]|uniref:2'-5' RNA ligase family protein n=1 Tax=Streptomyces sp. NPDC039016 TaxID=3154330 RepID=UPI0033FFCFB0
MTTTDWFMANHWWWRPGWTVGRRFYTWRLTFADQSDVHRYVGAHRDVLTPLPGLDLIPDQWLHLTMQGLGFTHEVDDYDVQAIIRTARSHLAALPPLQLTLPEVIVTPEAVVIPAQPAQDVVDLRRALRAAIAAVWPAVPESADGFRPHLSVAYSNSTGPAEPVQQAIENVTAAPATARITTADLIVIHRDRKMYEWETYAQLPLG